MANYQGVNSHILHPTVTWEFSLGSRMLHLKAKRLIPTFHRGFRAASGGVSVTSRGLFLVI